MEQGKVVDPVWELMERDAGRVLGNASPRRAELVNISIARDVGGWLLGQVPLVGELLSDAFEDNLWVDMRRRLTPREIETFTEVTRWLPDTIALLTTFQRMPVNEGQP